MPKIETFKTRTRHPKNFTLARWKKVLGVGFEYRGVHFFYDAQVKDSTEVTHVASGLWVCRMEGRTSVKAGKEALDGVVEKIRMGKSFVSIHARRKQKKSSNNQMSS